MDYKTEFTLWLTGLALFSILIVEVIHWVNGGKTLKGWIRENKKAWKEALDKAKN